MTKYPVRKVELAEKGVSTLAAREIWLDEAVMRLNDEGRGRSLGKFHGDDRILEITKSGEIRLLSYDFATHFEPDSPLIEKWRPNRPVSVIYFDGEKKKYFVKRFVPDKSAETGNGHFPVQRLFPGLRLDGLPAHGQRKFR